MVLSAVVPQNLIRAHENAGDSKVAFPKRVYLSNRGFATSYPDRRSLGIAQTRTSFGSVSRFRSPTSI